MMILKSLPTALFIALSTSPAWAASGDASRGYELLFGLAVAYFFPALVAKARRHHNTLAIFLLNLLLGWSGLGWIAALVWAATAVNKPPQHDNRIRLSPKEVNRDRY